jgi:hypothetical protein
VVKAAAAAAVARLPRLSLLPLKMGGGMRHDATAMTVTNVSDDGSAGDAVITAKGDQYPRHPSKSSVLEDPTAAASPTGGLHRTVTSRQ